MGRTYREEILEKEHQKYLNETIHKQGYEDVYQEKEIMKYLKDEMDKEASVTFVILMALGVTIGILGLVVYALYTAFS